MTGDAYVRPNANCIVTLHVAAIEKSLAKLNPIFHKKPQLSAKHQKKLSRVHQSMDELIAKTTSPNDE